MNNYVRTYKSEARREKVSLMAKILLPLAAFTAVLHIISAFSEPFSDFFNSNISSLIRAALAFITNFIPFSLAELLIILLPVFAFLLIRYAVKNHAESLKGVLIYALNLFSVICAFYVLFFWCFGVGYNTESIDKKLDIERDTVSVEELVMTADILAGKTNEEAQGVLFRDRNFSVMPYGIAALSDKLCDAYDVFSGKTGLARGIDTDLKPVMLSDAMAYTHITGIYSYFTGEANINTVFPDYTLPFTAAHEMAHQRGIAREDEANFVAFLVCIESEDAYIRYSGYLNLLEYVLNALYTADKDAYNAILDRIDLRVLYDIASYNEFFEKYEDSVASDISGTVNDTYLKLNGTEGEKSYGMVVDLAVAFFGQNNK